MQYRSGAAQVVNGSATVLLFGATFGAEMIEIGNLFKTDRDGDSVYQISSRTPSSGASITELTLAAPYGGESGAGLFYQIVSDFTVNRGYPRPAQGDSDAADWISQALDEIDRDISALLGTADSFLLETTGLIFKTAAGIETSASKLNWDNTLKRLGIGRVTPQYKVHIGFDTEVDGVMLTSLVGGTPMYGLYDGVTMTTLQSIGGAPTLVTDAVTLTFYDSGAPRMRLDQGRLVIGNGGAGGANAGDVVLANAKAFRGLNVGGSSSKALVQLNTADEVLIAGDGSVIRLGTTPVALGGQAVATLGTAGGSGPTNTAQKYWFQVGLSTGEIGFISIWV